MSCHKVNITLQDDLLSEIDQYCKQNHVTRSGLLAMAAQQWLMAKRLQPDVTKAFAVVGSLLEQAVAVNGLTVDNETYQKGLQTLQQTQASLEGVE